MSSSQLLFMQGFRLYRVLTSGHAGDGVEAGVFLWLAYVLSVVVCLVVLVAPGVPAMCRVAGGGQ
ncbi:hypothetical protein BPY_08770 [Bifidobacterium psychraerophilum]